MVVSKERLKDFKSTTMTSKKSQVLDALTGKGVTAVVFLQQVAFSAVVLVLCKNHPDFKFVFDGVTTPNPMTAVALATIFFWFFPFAQFAYFLDRVGAVRAQFKYLANPAYAMDLVKTLPVMLPYTEMVIDNIEQVGPLIPLMMQPGCKEYFIPVMGETMVHLELLLEKSHLLTSDVMLRLAPEIKNLLPYMPELAPHMENMLFITEVPGWGAINEHLPGMIPHLDVLAPHFKTLADNLPALLEDPCYMRILVKHMDLMVMGDNLPRTMAVLHKIVPLLPLMPIADAAGLLDQKLAFSALPLLANTIPVGPETSGMAAKSMADLSGYLGVQAALLQNMLIRRSNVKQISNNEY